MSEAHQARQRAALALGLDDFVTQGVAALPTGPAWSREPGSVRRALLRGLLGNHAYAVGADGAAVGRGRPALGL